MNAGVYVWFRGIVIAALCAGVTAGLVVGAIHVVAVTPIIIQAEHYTETTGTETTGTETAGTETAGHSHAAIEPPAPSALKRDALTLLAASLAGIACALLLCAGLVLRGGRISFATGLAWGLGGFAAFSLAPSLGLPPDLPGVQAAALPARQIWWLATVLATSGGLALLAFGYRLSLALTGLALIVMPHLLGAPQPPAHTAVMPESLIRNFTMASLGSNLAFWLVLGLACVAGLRRFGTPSQADSLRATS